MLSIASQQRNVNENHNEILPTSVRVTTKKMTRDIKYRQIYRKKEALEHCPWEHKLVPPL